MRIQGLAVLAPTLCVGLEARHFPARFTDFGSQQSCLSVPFAKLLLDDAMLGVGLPVHVEGKLDEGTKALLALPQLVLCKLALGDVSDQRQEPPPSSMLERTNANFDGERGAIFAAMMAFERDRFFRRPVLREPRNGYLLEIRVERLLCWPISSSWL